MGAYHERERLCPEGVRVVEVAHVHYGIWRLTPFSQRVSCTVSSSQLAISSSELAIEAGAARSLPCGIYILLWAKLAR